MSDSSKNRWAEISDIFDLALAREPHERGRLIEAACAGDAQLRREVEDLFAAHDASPAFIAHPVFGETRVGLLSQPLPESFVGKRFGSYKVISELGRGGMGTVCLGVRDDEQYQKRVAIKFVKRGMDTDEIIQRFRYERQILAGLDHPNIARILDGGTTEDRLPYFVMEYAEGLPINRYCDAHRLNTTERLHLFRTVCLAVSYAHQNLVVHRDLKPNNIIVTEAGQPKLLDFGIAKLLKPDLFPQAVIPTGISTRPMTPDYASPEQVRGLPITTASDVYSLGVLLYELLTGHRPYRLRTYSTAEIERVICEEEPERPSTAINRTEVVTSPADSITVSPESVSKTRDGQPDKLRRRLEGDLDNILLMALRKEPKRRYASVEQFSEDIRRHLEGLPVLAHGDTWLYRGGKFVRRNRIALAATVSFFILLVGFTVAFGLQAQRAERQRLRAEKISSFMAEIFKVADPSKTRGKTITAREMVDAGAARLETELNDQPETKGTLLHTIGEVYFGLGLYEQSEVMFEKALPLRRQTLGNQSAEVAITLERLGLSRAFRADYSRAEGNYAEALAIWRRLPDTKPERIAGLLNKLGRSAIERNDWEEAANHLSESLAVARQIYGDKYESNGCRDSDRSAPCSERTLSFLAFALQKKGDLATAEKFYRQAVEVYRRNNPTDYDMADHPQHILAEFISDTKGDFAAAEALHREVLDNRLRLYGDQNIGVAYSRWALSFALEGTGKYAEAEFELRENARISENIFGREHPRTVSCFSDLGRFLIYQRKFDEAEDLLRQSSALQIKAQSAGHPVRVLPTRLYLATLLNEKGDRAEAEKLLLEILPLVKQRYVAPDEILGLTLLEYGKVLLARGAAAQAESYLREARDNLNRTGNAFKWNSAEAESALGECLAALGREAEARPLLKEGLRHLSERLGPERHWLVERARHRLARYVEK